MNQSPENDVYYAPQPGAPQYMPQAAPPSKEKNTVGLIGFIIAVVGFVFACIPGALIIGWILLPVGFIMSIVGLCLSGKKKGLSIAGLIISVVGTIVGFMVFFSVVATSFDEAFSSETTVAQPTAEAEAEVSEPAAEETPANEEGTRANPYPLGAVISQADWDVTINGVNLDGTEQVMAENPFNEEPAEGQVYILVNVTATYTGSEPDGEYPFAMVEYVTVDGNTVNGLESLVVTPDLFDQTKTLYEGASVTGNIALQVPADTAGDGVLAVQPSVFGDKVFVAVK